MAKKWTVQTVDEGRREAKEAMFWNWVRGERSEHLPSGPVAEGGSSKEGCEEPPFPGERKEHAESTSDNLEKQTNKK